MRILVTGAKGFVGKNLCAQLKNIKDGKLKICPISIEEIMEYDIDSTPEQLDEFCSRADFVFNFAGINRPTDKSEFIKGNFGFASAMLDSLKKNRNRCPVMISSSVQAELDNPYGKSKLAGEMLLRNYAIETGAKVLIYRFPNLFGKWCRPNYNSVVATFCHNIANDLPIQINNPDTELTLLYIDDLVDEMIAALMGKEHHCGDFCYVDRVHKVRLGTIAETLRRFRMMQQTLDVPDLKDDSFEKKLYSTYLTYLPQSKISYFLKMNSDERGSFTEIIRSACSGQFSVNISKPGITKGEHWHNSKNEKFIVVSGHGLIQLRQIGTDRIMNFEVSGEKMEVVEMIPGCTHNIINLSDTENLVTLIWCNEIFNPQRPDTFHENVEK